MKEISRSTDKREILVEGNETVKLTYDEMSKKYNIHRIIRLHNSDFKRLPKQGFYMHFNLQCTDHKKGKNYALVRIAKSGYFDGHKEILPVITFKDARYAVCISEKNNVQYSKLKDSDFKYSLSTIKNVAQLKKAILRRYRKSMAHLSDREKLSLGVSMTRLKIIKML